MTSARLLLHRDGSHRVTVMRNARALAGTVDTVEGETVRGDRATASIEDIWCEKIRGCSIVRLTPLQVRPVIGLRASTAAFSHSFE